MLSRKSQKKIAADQSHEGNSDPTAKLIEKNNLKLSIDGLTLSTYETTLIRICSDCSRTYSIFEYAEGSDHYFYRPTNYKKGCERHCLECWLGVSEPLDTPPEKNESIEVETPCPEIHQHWYDEASYRNIDQGDLGTVNRP